MGALTAVLAAIELLVRATPVIVQAGSDLKPFALALYQKLSGGQELTDTQRAVLLDAIDALYARLEQPLPPAQLGDPDYKS